MINIRVFIGAALLLAGVCLANTAGAAGIWDNGEDGKLTAEKPAQSASIAVSPVEDLMREHGVLDRLLLIYEEIITRLDKNQAFPLDALSRSTVIIRNFIQNYHEKLEEDYLFTRFHKAGKFVDLVNMLKLQHLAGRNLIDVITTQETAQNSADKKGLAESMRLFIRLYRPHKAREDTILFPALHSVVSPSEYNELGETFEDREEQLFGKGGFENIVSQVEEIERSLNIYDLSRFVPIQCFTLPAWEEIKKGFGL
jgi:hemerythrin-like domain-containing protein